MPQLTGLPLGDDIVDRILSFLPDFASLRAFILTSKSTYNVFRRYPNSIIREIAYNVTGPLPSAMRLVRYNPEMEDADSPGSTETAEISLISHQEAHAITRCAEVATKLEDIFSRRYKDRSFKTSKLSSYESWRFRRALYRVMLYSKKFWPRLQELTDGEDDLETVRRERQHFFAIFSTSELLELRALDLFLHEICEYLGFAYQGSYDEQFGDYLLAAGPDVILECYEDGSLSPITGLDFFQNDLRYEVYQQFIGTPLTKILGVRKVKLSDDITNIWTALLDEMIDVKAQCRQCSSVKGLALWNKHNWDFLLGRLPPYLMTDLLKAKLKYNVFERQRLYSLLDNKEVSYSEFMNGMFDLKIPAFAAWAREDLVCMKCLQDFIKEHAFRWLLEHKREGGYEIQEDCWYGYNCRTQTHKPEHAKKLNHLCEPTWGDDNQH